MKKGISLLVALTLLFGLFAGGAMFAGASNVPLTPQESLTAMLEDLFYMEQIMLVDFSSSNSYKNAYAALKALESKGAALTEGELAAASQLMDDAFETVGGNPFADFGDINRDGFVDSTDARLALQYEVGLLYLIGGQQYLGDVSASWWAAPDAPYVVDSTDARLILQYEVALIWYFPIDPSDPVTELAHDIAETRAALEAMRTELVTIFGQALVTELFANFDAIETLLASSTFAEKLLLDDVAALKQLTDTVAPLLTTYVKMGLMTRGEWDAFWAGLAEYGIVAKPFPTV